MFAVLLAEFLRRYFSADPERVTELGLLLLPDVLWSRWTGGHGGLLDRALPVLLAAAWLVASGAAGWLLLARLQFGDTITRAERHVFELAAGLGAMSLATLLVGWLVGLQAWLFYALVGAVLLLWLMVWRRQVPRRGQETSRSDGPSSAGPWRRWCCWLLAPLAATYVLGALLPPWEFDVMEYHLQVPKEWAGLGRITFLPHNVYGNMPLGAEMHALGPMMLLPGPDNWWTGAVAGKLVMASFTALTAAATVLAGCRWFTPATGWLAAAVLLGTPWTFHLSVTGLNEGVLACYTLLSVYGVIRWTEVAQERKSAATGEQSPSPPARGARPAQAAPPEGWSASAWLLLSGWLIGCAVACKYTMVVFLAAPLLLVVVCWRWRWRWRCGIVLILAAAAAGGGWYAKSWWQTGNPVYPLAYEMFGGRSWSEEKSQRWQAAHFARGHSLRQLADKIASLGWKGQHQGPLLIPLLLLGVIWLAAGGGDARQRRMALWLIAAMACSFALWWSVTHRLDRFLFPVAPLAALLAGRGAAALDHGRGRAALLIVLASGLVVGWLPMVSGRLGDNRMLMSLQALREDPEMVRLHPAHRMLNRLAPPGKRALLEGEAQVFDLEVEILYHTCFDDSPLERLLADRSPQQQRESLREAGISHVFVYWREIDRYRSPGNYGFSAYVTPERIEQLEQQGLLRRLPVMIDEDRVDFGSTLYEVLP